MQFINSSNCLFMVRFTWFSGANILRYCRGDS